MVNEWYSISFGVPYTLVLSIDKGEEGDIRSINKFREFDVW